MKRTTSIKVTITVMALLAFLSITPNLEGVPNELGITTVSAATYPTKWTPMPNSTYRTSLKYRKASTAATAGYVMSMYNQKNDPNVYYTFTFQYRQLSKGRYDSNGTYLGDYEIRQTLRSYKNSARTQLIYTSTTTQKTTTLMPWMF